MKPTGPQEKPLRPPSLWSALFSPKMVICLFNGAAAGLPLFYIYQLIPAWLRSESISLKSIGLLALVGLPYNWKFLWSALFDQVPPPFLGRRRGWMLLTQGACMGTMFYMATLNPQESLALVSLTAAALAFFSASQDIVLDAYRRELLEDSELGLGNSMYMNGYRAMTFIPAGLGLILADFLPWSTVHIIIGLFMCVALAKTLLIPELHEIQYRAHSLREAVWEPFKEFLHRKGTKGTLLFLAFLFCYKLGDNMATALSTPFYIDLGFSKTVIGSTVKLVSFWSTLLGSFIGGVGIYKMGINKSLWIFGLVQWVSIFGFALLAQSGPVPSLLVGVLAFEYLGVGLGASALTAFMARATHIRFTSTQLALFTSLVALPRTLANSTTGFLIEGVAPGDGWFYQILGPMEGLGYPSFFVLCGGLASLGMGLLFWVAPWKDP